MATVYLVTPSAFMNRGKSEKNHQLRKSHYTVRPASMTRKPSASPSLYIYHPSLLLYWYHTKGTTVKAAIGKRWVAGT